MHAAMLDGAISQEERRAARAPRWIPVTSIPFTGYGLDADTLKCRTGMQYGSIVSLVVDAHRGAEAPAAGGGARISAAQEAASRCVERSAVAA